MRVPLARMDDRQYAVAGRRPLPGIDARAADRHEDTGPHGLPDHSQYLYAPQIRNDEEVERGYGGCIPPETGSEKRTGKGADHKGQALPEAGIGYELAVGGEILMVVQ